MAMMGGMGLGPAIKGLVFGLLAASLGACAAIEEPQLTASFGAENSDAILVAAQNAPVAEVVPEEDRRREAVIAHIPFNVALWLRRDVQRQFMVQRVDLQPMFLTDWSQVRAETAVIAAYGQNECRQDSLLMLEKTMWDPTGVWVIDAACRDPLSVLQSLRPFPKLRPAR